MICIHIKKGEGEGGEEGKGRRGRGGEEGRRGEGEERGGGGEEGKGRGRGVMQHTIKILATTQYTPISEVHPKVRGQVTVHTFPATR